MEIHQARFVTAITVLAIVLGLLFIPGMLYTVDETKVAVVLQFGKPVAHRTEPGLYFKAPWVQQVVKLPKTLQFWGGEPEHVLPDLPTADGKKIHVVPWAIWRINDPTVFVQKLREVRVAEERVADFVRGAMRDAITQHDLSELVRSTNRELTHSLGVDPRTLGVSVDHLAQPMGDTAARIQFGRERILERVKEEAIRSLATDASSGTAAQATGRGIELVDLGIAKIDFVPAVRQAAFARQIALMQSVASLYTNEGERAKQEILNRTNAEVQRIEGEGQQKANETKGAVDAEVIRAYAAAIREAGDFFAFVRTLEAFKRALNSDTRLILTTDSEFFRLLKQMQTTDGRAE